MVFGPGMAVLVLPEEGLAHLVMSLPAGIGCLYVKILFLAVNLDIIPPVLTA